MREPTVEPKLILPLEIVTRDEDHIGYFCDGHVPFDDFCERIREWNDENFKREEYELRHCYMRGGDPESDDFQPLDFSLEAKSGYEPATQAIWQVC
jgi:hypothetical protein